MKSSPKERILAVERILYRHREGISMKEILAALEREYDIKAERKSIYDDLAVLTRYLPIDVDSSPGRYTRYVLLESLM